MNKLLAPFNDLLHLFFPHNCVGCGTDVIQHDHQLCLRCITELPSTNFFKHYSNPVEQLFYGRLPIRNGAAGFFFTKDSLLQNLLIELKYRGNKSIGFYLGNLLGDALEKSERFASVDAIVPLPLNPKREKSRGYNQATVLCEGIASVWNKPLLDKAIGRKIYTETQTQMGRIERLENMDGVFYVLDPASIQNKHILLVDDVVTTGASLDACGSEILKTTGTTLSIATLAYTI